MASLRLVPEESGQRSALSFQAQPPGPDGLKTGKMTHLRGIMARGLTTDN